jgi:5-formyltetrahydrofolate cyclo-ligase
MVQGSKVGTGTGGEHLLSMTSISSQDPVSLRRQMRRQRANLSPREQARAALSVARRLQRVRLLRPGQRIALYLPQTGELGTEPTARLLRALGISLALPVLHPFLRGRLWFHRWTPRERWQRNRFDIREPRVRSRGLVSARDLDIVLTPLLACDPDGHRLGMGGGYYDRSFAFLLRRSGWRRPRLIGLAHDFQLVAQLPVRAWDVPLDGILTPTRFLSGVRQR